VDVHGDDTPATVQLKSAELEVIADSLKGMRDLVERVQSRDITKSPHLYEGEAAVPKPVILDAEVVPDEQPT
jgi:hypothetical protein